MWREYTRETHVHPAWTHLATALGLLAATILAWALTERRTVPPELGDEQSLASWPVRFATPKGYVPVVLQGLPTIQYSQDGSISGEATYTAGSLPGVPQIWITYVFFPDGTTIRKAAAAIVEEPFEVKGRVDMGFMQGRLIRTAGPFAALTRTVVGVDASGLAVGVQYLGPTIRRREVRLLEAVCRSLAYQDWSLPRIFGPAVRQWGQAILTGSSDEALSPSER